MNYFINTTKHINYSVKSVVGSGNDTFITLERLGDFPMPIDLIVTYKDGTTQMLYVPINETLGSKKVEGKSDQRIDFVAWPWVNPTYTLKLEKPISGISSVEIDPLQLMVDIDRKNNKLDLSTTLIPYQDPTK
jgi:hypothetical protein